MKYLFAIVLIVLSGCSNSPTQNKIDVNQLIRENNLRTITVDSLFEISFPQRFTKTEHLSEIAILQFNDLSSEEHLIILNSGADSVTISLKDKIHEIVRVNEMTNTEQNNFKLKGVSIENYGCDVSVNNSLEEYSYWLTRFKWSSESYTVCRWTLKENKENFIKDANLMRETIQVL